MPSKKVNKATGRDYSYDKEYESSPEQKKNRAKRNAARRAAKRSGKDLAGKDIDHKKKLSSGGGNGEKNLRVRDKSSNRSDNLHKKGETQRKKKR